MGSGDWFKTIISKKKSKRAKSKHAKLSGKEPHGGNQTNQKLNGPSSSSDHEDNAALEEWAATRIQNAFRKYRARKTLRCLRGVKRLRVVGQANPVKKQTAATLNYIQSWNKLQSEIRNRRAFMVTEGCNRKKKQENQMKLEAKLQNLQVEWNGGSDTMDEILARIQQREEAAVKRERAMAYAFNHQWRARSATGLGNFSYEVGKGGWGWSWMDRWIAARPWEPRSLVHPENPKKAQAKKENSSTNPSALKLQGSITLSNNINDRKTPKKKPLPSPSPADQKKTSTSPSTDQKKPSPSPSTDQKKPSPSPSTDQKKPSPSPSSDQKKLAPSPSSDQKKPAPKEQRAKAAGTPPKPKAKEMKGSQEKKQQQQQQQQQVVPSVSA